MLDYHFIDNVFFSAIDELHSARAVDGDSIKVKDVLERVEQLKIRSKKRDNYAILGVERLVFFIFGLNRFGIN